MAEYDDYEDGSDLVRQLRKQVKELSSALKERDEMLDGYISRTREEQIGQSLSALGLNPKIAKFVPDDVEDEDDLNDWLGEYGEVFGASPNKDAAEGSVHAAELMSAVEEGGIDPEAGRSLEQRIQNASTPEELTAILRG
jgi:hypothetical protein